MIQPGSAPRGCLASLAAEIKKVVDIPVTVAGRMNDPVLADAVIHEGKADFVSLGRPLLADPEYPNQAKEGRFEDIRTCTACYHCFDMEFGRAEPLQCAINASAGRELESGFSRAPKAKRVIVIGGGPGGMEAARVAALRGHTITLYEKEPNLGGQLLTASIPPGKGELATTTNRILSLRKRPRTCGSLHEGKACISKNLSGRKRTMPGSAHLHPRHPEAYGILCP